MTFQPLQTLTDRQINELHQLYQNEWWSEGRTLPDVKVMLSQTDFLFGLVHEPTDRLAAFCRVLSDRVYRALVFDVIVNPDYRGQGLGKMLIDQVVAHPELAQVECLQLFCKPEMVSFYEKFDFQPMTQIQMMKRLRSPQ